MPRRQATSTRPGPCSDALTIRRRKGGSRAHRAIAATCCTCRVPESNIALLNTMGGGCRVVAPRTLLPGGDRAARVEVFHDMARGLADVDIVMMLRLQSERMHGSLCRRPASIFTFSGSTTTSFCVRPSRRAYHCIRPMNVGGLRSAARSHDIDRSYGRARVEMGVAVRMACSIY